MKLILPVTFFWTLLSSAGALQCLTCTDATDATCSSTASLPCPSQIQCLTANVQGLGISKACAPSSVCPATGNQTFSFSSTGSSGSINAQCCNTDNCNVAMPSTPTVQSVNNLQCYSCDATNRNCSIRIQCKGVEDRCFQMNVTVGANTLAFRGCASANLCTAASSFTSILGLSTMSCCQNSLCNSAPAVATTAHLLLSLLVFSLYYN